MSSADKKVHCVDCKYFRVEYEDYRSTGNVFGAEVEYCRAPENIVIRDDYRSRRKVRANTEPEQQNAHNDCSWFKELRFWDEVLRFLTRR